MTDSAKPTVSESETDLESSVPRERFVRDQWQVGLFDCGHHCIPNGWMACFCPCVSLAQISARFEPDSFRSVLIKQLVFDVVFIGVLVVYVVIAVDLYEVMKMEKKKKTKEFSRSDERRILLILSLGGVILMLIVSWFTTRTISKLRTRVRERFRIPGAEEDDNMLAIWCGKCAIAQMATQVTSYTPRSCGFSKPDQLPAFIY